MLQAKFTIENQQAGFLEKYRIFGFKNKSEMVRAALNIFRNLLSRIRLSHPQNCIQRYMKKIMN